MTTPTPRQCDQCGRTGTRQFRTLDMSHIGAPDMVLCTNKNACRRRWPRPTRDDE